MSNIFLLDSVRILNSKSSEAFICIWMNFRYDKLWNRIERKRNQSNFNVISEQTHLGRFPQKGPEGPRRLIAARL